MSRRWSAALAVGRIGFLAATCVGILPSAIAEEPANFKAERVEISYVAPTNPAHQQIYELMKKRHVLERFKLFLSPMRLPGTLLLKATGCDGEANAWYDESDHSVTICYEYLYEVQSNAPATTTEAGVTPEDALIGPAMEVFLHEISHALFNLLQVPILGREEDAADQVADYMLLHLDRDVAREAIAGVAYTYRHEMLTQSPPGLKQFASEHGLSGQRLYNALCMAYGADPELFGDVVKKGYLPESRAEGCGDEYKQVDYAVKKLILPYVDEEVRQRVQPRKMRPGPQN